MLYDGFGECPRCLVDLGTYLSDLSIVFIFAKMLSWFLISLET